MHSSPIAGERRSTPFEQVGEANHMVAALYEDIVRLRNETVGEQPPIKGEINAPALPPHSGIGGAFGEIEAVAINIKSSVSLMRDMLQEIRRALPSAPRRPRSILWVGFCD